MDVMDDTFGLFRSYVASLMAPPLIGLNRTISDASGFITSSVLNVVNLTEEAQASQAAALASANAAQTSASASADSAAKALSSQTIVQNLTNSYNKVWLGTQTSDPTTDLNGDPLVEGARYWNSTANNTRIYHDGKWEDYDYAAEQEAADAALSAQQAAASQADAAASATSAASDAAATAADKTYIDGKLAGLASYLNVLVAGNANDYLMVSPDGTEIVARTPAQVLSDIGGAPLSSPSLTGTPTVPTAAKNSATTQIANTAFVLGQASSLMPLMDGVGAIGVSYLYARADHQHASDTSRALLAGSDKQQFSASMFSSTLGVPTAGVASKFGYAFLDGDGFYGTGLYSGARGVWSLYANAALMLQGGVADSDSNVSVATPVNLVIQGGSTSTDTSISNKLKLVTPDGRTETHLFAANQITDGIGYTGILAVYNISNRTEYQYTFGLQHAYDPSGSVFITSDTNKLGQIIDGALSVGSVSTPSGAININTTHAMSGGTGTNGAVVAGDKLSGVGLVINGGASQSVSLNYFDYSNNTDTNEVGGLLTVTPPSGSSRFWEFRQDGTTLFPNTILAQTGTTTSGGYAFYNDATTGLFSSGNGLVNIYSDGVLGVEVTPSMVNVQQPITVSETIYGRTNQINIVYGINNDRTAAAQSDSNFCFYNNSLSATSNSAANCIFSIGNQAGGTASSPTEGTDIVICNVPFVIGKGSYIGGDSGTKFIFDTNDHVDVRDVSGNLLFFWNVDTSNTSDTYVSSYVPFSCPTAALGDNSNTAATTAFVKGQGYIQGGTTSASDIAVSGIHYNTDKTFYANCVDGENVSIPSLYYANSNYIQTSNPGQILQFAGNTVGIAFQTDQNCVWYHMSSGATSDPYFSIHPQQGVYCDVNLTMSANTALGLGPSQSRFVFEGGGHITVRDNSNNLISYWSMSDGNSASFQCLVPITCPTPGTGDNSALVATTAFVKNQNYVCGTSGMGSGDIGASGLHVTQPDGSSDDQAAEINMLNGGNMCIRGNGSQLRVGSWAIQSMQLDYTGMNNWCTYQWAFAGSPTLVGTSYLDGGNGDSTILNIRNLNNGHVQFLNARYAGGSTGDAASGTYVHILAYGFL